MAPKMKTEGTRPLKRVYKKLRSAGRALFRLIRRMEDSIGPQEVEMTTAKALTTVASLKGWVERLANKHEAERERVLDRMSAEEKEAAHRAAKRQGKTKK